MAKKNRYLFGGTPPELAKIQRVRARLIAGGTDRDDHLKVIDDWEKRVKDALIALNLQKHEGVKMLMRRAGRELLEIDDILRTQRPKSLTPDDALAFAHETTLLHERKRLWEWFMGLFSDAREDLEDVMSEVMLEFEGERDDGEPIEPPEPESETEDDDK